MNRIELENSLDRDSRRFLAAIDYYGGEANTSEIRTRTGLTASKVHTRYNKLEELGLIDVTYADSGYGDRRPPKIAHLTGKARMAIEWGILHDIDTSRTPEEIRDLETEVRVAHEQNAELCQRLNALEELIRQTRDRVVALENDVDDVYDWSETVEDSIRTLWAER
ncbi:MULTISPECIES: MarR family transcriptional regulator [Haloferax]|uniref:Uncharacterized protein n=1 Tax=Haloferax marinum TaxID=2666143 RepID=A0A6A8G7G3_9EURY|nr:MULTISPECIES: MarR family transcriptional regulator [Haloferax]KAB1197733.1 hypothetical protein Hfx1150_09440 [Haloferax sp. CBA1150]MRW96787.1 hypothetical protein [Haloferax marinum]